MILPILLLFIISYFLHFSARFPALSAMRIDFVLGGLLLIVIFMTQLSDKWRVSILTSRRLNIFLIYIFLSLPVVTWPGSVIRLHLIEWIKVALFYIFVISVVRTEKQLKWIMTIFLVCQTFRILEPLYLHIATGYWGDVAYTHVGGVMTGLNRLSGAPFDVVNSNQLAWVIVTTLPFFFYLLWQGEIVWKVIFLATTPFFVQAMLLTGSRSGLISLVATIGCIIYYGKKRLKYLIIAIVVLLPVSFFVVKNMTSGLLIRYESLVVSGIAGSDTAHGRINAWNKQFESILNNPLFGNGLGTSRETNFNVIGGSSQITHSLYIEILQETGIIGFVLFMLFVASIIKILGEAKVLLEQAGKDGKDWLYRLISATQVWVFMDLLYSFSCFGLRSWEWYFFGGVATACLAIARDYVVSSEQLVQDDNVWSKA